MGRLGKTAALLTLSLALVGSSAALPAQAVTAEQREMVQLTNDDRDARNLGELRLDRELSRYAKRHSKAMAGRDELFHTKNLARVLDGRKWRTAGENVGVGFPGDLGGLQDAFMDSTGHRRNIINEDFKRIATGVYDDGDGRVWVTIIFYG